MAGTKGTQRCIGKKVTLVMERRIAESRNSLVGGHRRPLYERTLAFANIPEAAQTCVYRLSRDFERLILTAQQSLRWRAVTCIPGAAVLESWAAILPEKYCWCNPWWCHVPCSSDLQRHSGQRGHSSYYGIAATHCPHPDRLRSQGRGQKWCCRIHRKLQMYRRAWISRSSSSSS